MGKKIETMHSPADFYDNDTIPNESAKINFFALDKDASPSDIVKVSLLMSFNKVLDEIKEGRDEKELAEWVQIDPSDLSRFRRCRYKYFTIDRIVALGQKIVLRKHLNFTTNEMVKYIGNEIKNSDKKISIA